MSTKAYALSNDEVNVQAVGEHNRKSIRVYFRFVLLKIASSISLNYFDYSDSNGSLCIRLTNHNFRSLDGKYCGQLQVVLT